MSLNVHFIINDFSYFCLVHAERGKNKNGTVEEKSVFIQGTKS